eukprot:TRINITY_DN4155_c0_g1_i1.p1 TRINITY_DN4155_c0_g1~~TRINITY_DN4155_c0_g1_i1.p1  ORF type:complete len:113 (-),score=14.60 TRINITY_DN4155_c0_g1_i1:27-365(-)
MISDVIGIIAKLDPGTIRPFSVPVSSAAGYNGNSNPGLGALIELHDTLTKNIWNNRYVHSVNPFLPFDGLITQIFTPYKTNLMLGKKHLFPFNLLKLEEVNLMLGVTNKHWN